MTGKSGFIGSLIFILILTIFSLSACTCNPGKNNSSGGHATLGDDTSVSDDTAADDSVADDTVPDDDTWTTPPDIVVIMADDLDSASLDLLLEMDLMPNLKNYIIDQGTTFDESFVTNPLCCPSRATFITGQYSHNNNVLNNQPPVGGVSTLDDSSTLATWLHDAGYRTSLVGKYLNGYGSETTQTYIPPGWDDWQVMPDPYVYTVYDYDINDNGELVSYGSSPSDYQTDVIAQRAVRFINDNAGGSDPIFLWVAPVPPHTEFPENWFGELHGFADWYALRIRPAPRYAGALDLDLPDVPSFNEDDVSDKPLWVRIRPKLNATDIANARQQYNDRLIAMLSVDDLIGTVAKALDDAGRLNHTILMFLSDNGFFEGKHRVPQKTADYEEGIRVPLYIRVPGLPVQSTSRIVLNNDMAPTIVDFTGGEAGIEMDGRSLVPLLQNPDLSPWRKRFFIQHWAISTSILEIPTYSAVRTGPDCLDAPNMLYVYYTLNDQDAGTELYDLPLDQYQLDSLNADTSPERVHQMTVLRAQVQEFLDCKGQRCRDLEDFEGAPSD